MSDDPAAKSDAEEWMAEIDSTEVVQIVRRPDQEIEVDDGDLDPDTVLGIMLRGLIQYVVDDLFSFGEEEEVEPDDEDDA